MVDEKNSNFQTKLKASKNFVLFNNKNKIAFISFLIILLLQFSISKENAGEIYLVMAGPGTKQIFYYDRNTVQRYVSEVFVNGINKTNVCLNDCELEDNINNITIIFKQKVQTFRSLFYNSSYIIEIDLSKFDASIVTDMRYMFKGCTRLTSVNFKNLDTSQVTLMSEMFYGCNSLRFIDISNLKTSKVTDMENLFKGCKELVSIDLSNLDNSYF